MNLNLKQLSKTYITSSKSSIPDKKIIDFTSRYNQNQKPLFRRKRVIYNRKRFRNWSSLAYIPFPALFAIASSDHDEYSSPKMHSAAAISPIKSDSVRLRRTITDGYRFELDETKQIIVGTGNRSKVITAHDIETGQIVAIKKINRNCSSQRQWEEEIRMMRLAQGHRNCIRLLDFLEDGDDFYIIMEFAQGGELFRRLQLNGNFTEGEAARIMAEVLQAVEHLHSKGIVHFDIKPENIILRHCGDNMIPEVKLADFGSAFSKYHITDIKDFTLAYSAPEVVEMSCAIDEKADIWSMGVLMYLLLSGNHPFQSILRPTEEELKQRIINFEPDFDAHAMRHIGPVAKDLLKRMMSKDRRDRPSASEALSHAWFKAVLPLPQRDVFN